MLDFCLQGKFIGLEVMLNIHFEDRCEIPALNLVAATRRCLAKEEQFFASWPAEQQDHLLDLHLALALLDLHSSLPAESADQPAAFSEVTGPAMINMPQQTQIRIWPLSSIRGNVDPEMFQCLGKKK